MVPSSHSLTSVHSKASPEYPVIQVQVYPPNEFVHKAFTSHDLASGPTNIRREHSSRSMHVLPSSVNLASHSQVSLPALLTQVAFGLHSNVTLAHPSMSIQVLPSLTAIQRAKTFCLGEFPTSGTFLCPTADSIGTETMISIAIVFVKSTVISV